MKIEIQYLPKRRVRAKPFHSFSTAKIVVLAVYGPKWILPYPFKNIQADLNQTWLEVLRDTLNIQIDPLDASTLMVRTRYYRSGYYGHSVSLDSKIGDFINLFCYNKRKKSYSVLLCANTQHQDHLQQNPALEQESI